MSEVTVVLKGKSCFSNQKIAEIVCEAIDKLKIKDEDIDRVLFIADRMINILTK